MRDGRFKLVDICHIKNHSIRLKKFSLKKKKETFFARAIKEGAHIYSFSSSVFKSQIGVTKIYLKKNI